MAGPVAAAFPLTAVLLAAAPAAADPAAVFPMDTAPVDAAPVAASFACFSHGFQLLLYLMFTVATAHAAAARVTAPVLAAVSAVPAGAAVLPSPHDYCSRDCCSRGGCFMVPAPCLRSF
jgi:hypothetical protein